jgi:flagellar assembly factor FliW
MGATTLSGEQSVTVDDLVFEFPAGVPGYENATSFQLVPLGEAFGPYLGLRCTRSEQPVFVVVQPFAVDVDLVVEVDDLHQALLGLDDPNDALVLLVVTLNGPGRMPSANLVAPIVLNLRSRTGFQVLQPDSTLEMRHKLTVPFHDLSRAASQR